MTEPQHSNEPTCPCCGSVVMPLDLLIDEAHGHISYDGNAVRFPPSPFRLVKALIDAYPNMLTKEQCLDALADPDGLRDPPMLKIVDIQVHHLRKKLDKLGIVITTAWGIGYRAEMRADLKAEVMRQRRFEETRRVRGSVEPADVSAIKMLQAQGYPLTDIARRLRMTFKAVSTAADIIRADEEARRDRSRDAA